MFFSLIIFLMVMLVAAFWTYQGLFSSAIMFFEALIAAMLAFAFYEPLYGLLSGSLGPGMGKPIALMVIFVVSLAVFRAMTDRYVTKDVALPVAVNRVGGAVCGFFSGMMLVGMALIGIQMLPIGSAVFSFERMSYDTEKGGPTKSSAAGFLSPDKFTYGLVSMLSDGSRFGTDEDHALRRTKADLITQLYSRRASPQWEARVFLDNRDLEAKAYWQTQEIDLPTHKRGERDAMVRTFQTERPRNANDKFLVCTVVVKKSAAPEGKNEIRFRLPQFRLIGFDHGNSKEDPSVYLATGISDIYTNKDMGPKPVADEQRERLATFGPFTDFILDDYDTKVIETGDGYQFDVAFEVPRDFKPWYIEFKSGARADLSTMKELDKRPDWGAVAQGAGGLSGTTKKKEKARAPKNPWDVPSSIVQKTGFTELLPLQINASNPTLPPNVTTGEAVGKADGVQFAVEIPEEKPMDLFLTRFWVPNGKSMFIVTFDDPKKQSMWGGAIQFANRVVGQTTITDSGGNKYFAIGQYAIAKINGKWVYEIQYWPNAEIPERALHEPKRVTRRVLDQAGAANAYFGFIFLVPSDVVQIKEFQSGQTKPIELNINH